MPFFNECFRVTLVHEGQRAEAYLTHQALEWFLGITD